VPHGGEKITINFVSNARNRQKKRVGNKEEGGRLEQQQ
jgi:hypothetical protein